MKANSIEKSLTKEEILKIDFQNFHERLHNISRWFVYAMKLS